MKNLLLSLLSAMLSVMLCEPALLGQHANRYGGGSTCHAQGSDSTTRTNGYGGEATHTAGQGTSYNNKYGDYAYHAEGSGTTTGSNAYGAPRRILPAREHLQPAPMVAARPITRESARLE